MNLNKKLLKEILLEVLYVNTLVCFMRPDKKKCSSLAAYLFLHFFFFNSHDGYLLIAFFIHFLLFFLLFSFQKNIPDTNTKGSTCECPWNLFRDKSLAATYPDGKRIDYVMYCAQPGKNAVVLLLPRVELYYRPE